MRLGIKSNLQRMWSRAASTQITRRMSSGFVGEAVQLIGEEWSNYIDSPAYDYWRFPERGSEIYDARVTYKILHFLKTNATEIENASEQLADDRSRNLLKQLLAFRALGPRHVNPPKDVKKTLNYYRAAARNKISESNVDLAPFDVSRYHVDFEGEQIELDCWLGNVVATFFEKQYYFNRDELRIAPRRGDVVIDAGACFGDSALAFSASVGGSGVIHSFDPLPRQRSIYLDNQDRNRDLGDRLHVHEFALDNVSGRSLKFVDAGAASRLSSNGSGIEVRTISIDDFVESAGLARVDFIKMDIEGAESSALVGAREIMRRFRPRLAISAYHSLHDLTGLVGLIRNLEPSYRCYLDHHSIYSEETVLYATAD